MWRKLSTRVVFTHPRLEVHEDEVELPGGSRVSYLRIQEPGMSVSLLCRRHDGRFLLQRQYSYPPNQVMLELPGGLIPEGEDPKQGANRELMEEAGLRAERLTLLGEYFVNNRRSNQRMQVYLAEELAEASLPGDLEEQIETAWFTEGEVDELICQGQIVNLSILAAWSFYHARKPSI
jgi:ADP-ribose pyrophosphatase